MAQQRAIEPDPNTPRQELTVAKAIPVLGTIERAEVWGQVPEEGDPVAALQYAEVDHRTWKMATLQPFGVLPREEVQTTRRGVRGRR